MSAWKLCLPFLLLAQWAHADCAKLPELKGRLRLHHYPQMVNNNEEKVSISLASGETITYIWDSVELRHRIEFPLGNVVAYGDLHGLFAEDFDMLDCEGQVIGRYQYHLSLRHGVDQYACITGAPVLHRHRNTPFLDDGNGTQLATIQRKGPVDSVVELTPRAEAIDPRVLLLFLGRVGP